MHEGKRPDGDHAVADETLAAPAKSAPPPSHDKAALLETLAAPPPIHDKAALLDTQPAKSGGTQPGMGEPRRVTAPPGGTQPGVGEPRRKTAPPGDTQPGAGIPAERKKTAPPGAAMLHTMPAGGATLAAADQTLAGSVAPSPGRIIRPPSAQQSSTETLDVPPHGETLQGPHAVADLPSLPRVNDDTYAIGTEIARGGMGKILAARDRRLRREVVIKVMRREHGFIDPRFEREALITARLQHPSIVRVYDAGVLGDGRAFYAMERVRGRSLEVVLEGARTLRDRLALVPHAIAVCDALAYAHNEGVVHRDLKPSNVLLGPFGETVVIDWGLAKDLRAQEVDLPAIVRAPSESDSGISSSNSALTQHGAVMGTPAYMAPEQARGEVADERTDVYALGALIYTLLTGAPPVSGATSDEVIQAVASGRRKSLDAVEPDAPPELVTIVERAMALERSDRYPNAKEMADDLRSFTAGKLVPSHEYTTWELVQRWIAKNRLAVGIAATAIVVLVAGTIYAYRRVSTQRDRAEQAAVVANDAKNDAVNKKDNLVLEQVERLKPHDPSLAAAWLKELSPNALGWPQTHSFAMELRSAGLAHELSGHRNNVELVAPSGDGKHVATASDDGVVRRWDLSTGGSLELTGHAGPIDTMLVCHDGQYLATGGSDHKVILWELATGGRRELLGHGNTVRGVAFSADNKLLASTAEDGTLFLWDVASATGHELLHHTHSLRPVAWLDERTLIIGGFDGRIGRIDIHTKKVTWLVDHTAEIRSIAISPDKTLFVATDEDGRVTLWDARTNSKLRELTKQEDVARKAIITKDGKYVITAGGSKDVHVHTLPDGVFHALEGNEAGVKDIDVNDDGLVVAAGIDKTIHLWKLDGTLLHAWRGHTAGVKGIGFVGRYVVSGSEDYTVRVWPLDDPPPPPRGTALKAWLDAQTNLTVGKPDAP